MANRSRCCSPPEHLPTLRSPIAVIPARSSTSLTGLDWLNRLAVYWAVSSTVRSLSIPPLCSTADTKPREIAWCGDIPRTETSPELGRDRPRITSIVDVLPAPFGPRKATISPDAMLKSMPSTAWTGPKLLCTPRSSTASGASAPLGDPQPGNALVVVMDLIVGDRIVDRKWIIAAAFWKTRQGCSAEVVPVARQLLVLSVVKVARGRSADAITGYLTGTVTSCRVAGGTPPGRCTSHAVSRHVVLGAGSVQAAESSAERRLPPGRAIHR